LRSVQPLPDPTRPAMNGPKALDRHQGDRRDQKDQDDQRAGREQRGMKCRNPLLWHGPAPVRSGE